MRLVSSFCILITLWTCCSAESQQQSDMVQGKIIVPVGSTLANATVHLTLDTTEIMMTTATRIGEFAFKDVPKGVHFVAVDASGFMFPTVLIDTTGASIKAQFVDVPGTPAAPYPLQFFPLGKVQHFDVRQPFSIMAWLKTPYGIMIGMMLFSVLVMPYLKVDEQEYQAMLAEREKLSNTVMGRSGAAQAGPKDK